MPYAGLDLSRERLDVHVLDEEGETVSVTAVRPDGDALRTLFRSARTSYAGINHALLGLATVGVLVHPAARGAHHHHHDRQRGRHH